MEIKQYMQLERTKEMRKKRIFLVMMTVAAVLFASGCKQDVGTPEDNAVVEETDDKEENRAQDRLFGFLCPDMGNPFYAVLKDSVASALAEQGDRILVRDAKWDAEEQTAQLQEMIEQDVEAVFLCPVDQEALTPALEALDEAGIPVVGLDMRVAQTDLTDAYVGSDNYNAGQVCGEDLMANRPEGGGVVIVECPELVPVNERITGFEETIADGGFEIVKRIDTKRDNSAAEGEIMDLLGDGTAVDAVMCGDDSMAVDVLQALAEAGKSDILVYSVGGSPAIKSALADPTSPMTGVGAQSPINMGKAAVQTATAMLEGGVYETETYVETFFINRDNVDMYGTDGWQ